jgi:ribonuclease BN (tRNA processing enzyme)
MLAEVTSAPVSFLVLGSGSASAARFAASFALCGPDGPVLLDCGAPASTLLPQQGEELPALRAVLLSHFQVDHTADLPQLLQVLWLQNRGLPVPVRLPIYGPPGTTARVQWLERFYLMHVAGAYAPPACAPGLPQDAEPGVRYQLGPTTAVEFFETSHFASPGDQEPFRAANFGYPLVAYGMRLECAGRTIVYSGDSGAIDEVAPHLQDCALLVHEIAHHQPRDVCQLAADHDVPRLVLSHIPTRFDEPDSELAKVLADNPYRGELFIASDGLRIML